MNTHLTLSVFRPVSKPFSLLPCDALQRFARIQFQGEVSFPLFGDWSGFPFTLYKNQGFRRREHKQTPVRHTLRPPQLPLACPLPHWRLSLARPLRRCQLHPAVLGRGTLRPQRPDICLGKLWRVSSSCPFLAWSFLQILGF